MTFILQICNIYNIKSTFYWRFANSPKQRAFKVWISERKYHNELGSQAKGNAVIKAEKGQPLKQLIKHVLFT